MSLAVVEMYKANNHVPGPFFRGWWCFDTNCLSELVKQHRAGKQAQIRELIEGKPILVPCTVLWEMALSPVELVSTLPELFEPTLACLVPDNANLLEVDLWNFLNVEKVSHNSLNLALITQEFIDLFKKQPEAIELYREDAQKHLPRFRALLEMDRGSFPDIKTIGALVYHAVHRMGKQKFKVDIPPADCTVENFPAHFVFYYCHLFRYLKQPNKKIEDNDLVDYQHATATPLCERFYCEQSFCTLLRDQVKGTQPPNSYQIAKGLVKKGKMTSEKVSQLKSRKDYRREQSPLLANTSIFSFRELQTQLEAD